MLENRKALFAWLSLPAMNPTIPAGTIHTLKIIRIKSNGVYLDDGGDGILLPRRFVPEGAKEDDEIKVFIYHDNEARLIATTVMPHGILGDIVRLKAVGLSDIGAFLDWGLMKDLFVPKKNMKSFMRLNGYYLVKIVKDEKTERLVATEYFERDLDNSVLAVKESEEVQLTVFRRTEIGYEVIINNRHKGILHFNEVYRNISIGDSFPGFIKKIFKNKKGDQWLVDVVAGKAGYGRVSEEAKKILDLLHRHDGHLPYYDKSSPEEIYDFFGISKKAFKMAIGNLYKEKKIELTKSGIRLMGE